MPVLYIKEKAPSYFFQVILENNTPYTKESVQKSQIPLFFSIQKQTEPNKVFNVDFIKGLTFVTRIRLGLSQLACHKLRRNF